MDRGQTVRDRRRIAVRRFIERHEKETGESLTGLAKRAGLSEGTVRNYLAGTSNGLRVETCDKLAAVTGASVAEIIGDPSPTKTAPIDEAILLAAIRVYNLYLDQQFPNGFIPQVEPHDAASGISWFYSTLTKRKESEGDQGVKREINDLLSMMRSLRITPVRD